MEYNIYIDESGNTGNIELCEDLTWNFKDQKYFALGAIYCLKDQSDIIQQNTINILKKYDSKLGIENELKSKANYKFKNEMLEELLEMLIKNKVKFYFDIADKKFKVITNIVEYCIYPFYIFDPLQTRDLKIEAVNFLYRTLPVEKIKFYIDLCQKPETNEDTIASLTEFILSLKEHFNKNKIDKNMIDKVYEYIKTYKQHGLEKENLFPVKDFNNKGVGESFLPNVDAYNNIVGSIANLRLNINDTINIYHDEQKQFSKTLTYWTHTLKQFDVDAKTLDFIVSKDNIFIQIADFYTGTILRLYKEIVEKPYLERNSRNLLKSLKPILSNCNIVASQYDQNRFFEKCGLKSNKTRTPFT